MTYVFGASTYLDPRTAPVPQYEVNSDDANITVTHCKSDILINTISLADIKQQCHGPFEEIVQFIMSPITGVKGKNTANDIAAQVNCRAAIKFSDSAVSAINRIAQHNIHLAPLYRVGKF